VKVLLRCVHGGTLWLDPPVSIDTALIAHITGLPKVGEDPEPVVQQGRRVIPLLIDERKIPNTLEERGGLDVKNINDKNVRFAT
jgi:hypothetical protein